MYKLAILFLAGILVAGCSAKPTVEAPDTAPETQPAVPTQPDEPAPSEPTNDPTEVEGLSYYDGYGVGYSGRNGIDVHVSAADRITSELIDRARNVIRTFKPGFDYDVIRVSQDERVFSFTAVDDFDSRTEPKLLQTYIWDSNVNQVSVLSYNGSQQYVHKWLMVDPSYAGFNVADAQERSRKLLEIDGVDPAQLHLRTYFILKVKNLLDAD